MIFAAGWFGDRRRGQHHRRIEIDLALGLRQRGQREAALDELVGARRGQGQHLDVPPLELGEAPARADFGLQQADVALGQHDLGLDVFQCGAFGRDAQRDQIAAERRARDRRDPTDRAETAPLMLVLLEGIWPGPTRAHRCGLRIAAAPSARAG